MGWNIVREVAKFHEVWVLTRPDESKMAIEAELLRHPNPNLHFVYFTLPFWQDSLRWGQSGAMQLHYYLWQIQAYFVARRLHQDIGFDVEHHVTFVKYSSPSLLALLPIPFIWGPLGGGESAPAAFWSDFTLKNKLYETLRLAWRWIGELDPLTRVTARRSAIAFATTKDTAQRLRLIGASNVQLLSQLGLSQTELTELATYAQPVRASLRLISIGRLLHWKGFHLGLAAFAQANLTDAEYWIVGEGPERAHLEQLSARLGIADRVKFWGQLPREQVLQKLGECSVLVHPSLHDSGGGVCLEAMAVGRPVICLDLGGPAEQVTPETGYKVTAQTPAEAIAGLASAMHQLAEAPELRQQMGHAGQQRARERYSWAAKGQTFVTLYNQLTQTKELTVGKSI